VSVGHTPPPPRPPHAYKRWLSAGPFTRDTPEIRKKKIAIPPPSPPQLSLFSEMSNNKPVGNTSQLPDDWTAAMLNLAAAAQMQSARQEMETFRLQLIDGKVSVLHGAWNRALICVAPVTADAKIDCSWQGPIELLQGQYRKYTFTEFFGPNEQFVNRSTFVSVNGSLYSFPIEFFVRVARWMCSVPLLHP